MKRNIATIVEHYLVAALWTNDIDNMSVKCNMDSKAIKTAILQVQCFLGAALPLLTDDWTDEQIGHDLFLTRAGHGAGFWDRTNDDGTPKANRDKLTAICSLIPFHGEVVADEEKEIVYIEGDEDPLNLLENYEMLPQDVQDVLMKEEYLDETYENCDKALAELEPLGFKFDYYLDASPFNLRRIEEPTFEGHSEPYNDKP
jgi:hypothetical protein